MARSPTTEHPRIQAITITIDRRNEFDLAERTGPSIFVAAARRPRPS